MTEHSRNDSANTDTPADSVRETKQKMGAVEERTKRIQRTIARRKAAERMRALLKTGE
jgi:hypothetical protein